jgi:transposase
LSQSDESRIESPVQSIYAEHRMNTPSLPQTLAEARAVIEHYAALLAQAQATIARQEALIATLTERIAALERELEETKRRGKRQATPFSKGAPQARPKKPGQKPGHPPHHRPKPEHVDTVVEAALPSHCAACGGSVIEDAVQTQYQVDIPRPIPTLVTQINVHIGHCEQCQQRIQGRHPAQTSDALGAAAVQLGPHTLGLSAELKHGLGLAYGKVATLFESTFGLHLQRSSLVRADRRLAAQLAPSYQQLLLRLRESEVVHADETGWKVGGHSAWLWVFTNADLTVYAIDPTRAHDVVERILGTDFDGVLVCDCFLAYDALPYDQSKCAGHLLQRCAELQESKHGRALRFSQQVAELLRSAIQLKGRRTTLTPHGYAVACGRVEAELDRLLAGEYTDPDNARFAKLLRKHREQLLKFLYVEAVAPTNNAAERELRPAVIIRKTNGCNRSDRGAQTHSIVTSFLRTCQKQGHDFVNLVKRVLGARDPVVLDVTVAAPRVDQVPIA